MFTIEINTTEGWKKFSTHTQIQDAFDNYNLHKTEAELHILDPDGNILVLEV